MKYSHRSDYICVVASTIFCVCVCVYEAHSGVVVWAPMWLMACQTADPGVLRLGMYTQVDQGNRE